MAVGKRRKFGMRSHPQNRAGAGRKNLKLLLAVNRLLNSAYVLKESFGQIWDYKPCSLGQQVLR